MTTTSGSEAKGISEASCLTGDSWTLLQENYETGRILKFTQEGTSGLAALKSFRAIPTIQPGLLKSTVP